MFRRFLILMVLLAGCTAQEAAPPPVSSSPPNSSSVPVPDKWNQLYDKAGAAYAAKDAFMPDAPWNADNPAAPGGVRDNTSVLPSACSGVKLSSGFKVTRTRLWRGETKVVWQDVHALSEQRAGDLVEQIRVKSRTCAGYVRKEGKPERVVTSDAAVEPPAGFDDFYAYCETAPDVLAGQDNCQAYVARGEVLVNFGSSVVSDDPIDARETAIRRLREMLPVVAGALAAA
ncbi:MAG TPA: hypothetical protein VF821_35000 [Lentzea sp.]